MRWLLGVIITLGAMLIGLDTGPRPYHCVVAGQAVIAADQATCAQITYYGGQP